MKNSYKIREHRATISDEELEAFKNFDDLLVKREIIVTSKKQYIKLAKQTFFFVMAIASITAILFIYNVGTDKYGQEKQNVYNQPEPDSEDAFPMADSSAVKQEIDSASHEPKRSIVQGDKIEVQPKSVEKLPSTKFKSAESPKEEPKPQAGQKTDSASYQYIEAKPINGLPALYTYFDAELRYPKQAISDSVQGSVFVQFTINKEGKPENITVEQSLSTQLDAEAVRLIKEMPIWHPATINGNPIESKIRIPVQFSIKK